MRLFLSLILLSSWSGLAACDAAELERDTLAWFDETPSGPVLKVFQRK